MTSKVPSITFSLDPPDNKRLAVLCGQLDNNLKKVASYFNVAITNRGPLFSISGVSESAEQAKLSLNELYAQTKTQTTLNDEAVYRVLRNVANGNREVEAELKVRTPKKQVRPRSSRQYDYVQSILSSDVVFGVGPAGTGKTYLAVACAVQALSADEIERIVLVRPAVEAGERLGFLPGDIGQKVDPYLRPLYDALYELLGFERVARLLERNVIELAPLAYMRGRTLSNAFVILDEAQNTTKQQMKMFLTRMGFGSKAVITGDITQTDLPRDTVSGLRHAIETLGQIEGISVTRFTSNDVVRHALVQHIIDAYDAAKE
ncbi:MAG: PhoH family protein [Arenicellales bacterium]|nr:PhoH family protein [Arenicellales bacterium]